MIEKIIKTGQWKRNDGEERESGKLRDKFYQKVSEEVMMGEGIVRKVWEGAVKVLSRDIRSKGWGLLPEIGRVKVGAQYMGFGGRLEGNLVKKADNGIAAVLRFEGNERFKTYIRSKVEEEWGKGNYVGLKGKEGLPRVKGMMERTKKVKQISNKNNNIYGDNTNNRVEDQGHSETGGGVEESAEDVEWFG